MHLRIHRWVIWWIYVGVICGVLSVVNILGHSLTGVQDRILIVFGVVHWLLGGVVCWAFEGIKVEHPPASPSPRESAATHPYDSEHPMSPDLQVHAGR